MFIGGFLLRNNNSGGFWALRFRTELGMSSLGERRTGGVWGFSMHDALAKARFQQGLKITDDVVDFVGEILSPKGKEARNPGVQGRVNRA